MSFFVINSFNIAAIFHLFNHAFFKALLFLYAASIMNSVINEQNIYKLAGSNKIYVLISCLLDWGLLPLIGLPFSSGFYSKDFILRSSVCIVCKAFGHVLCCGVFLTSSYGIKLLLCSMLHLTAESSFKTHIISIMPFKYYLWCLL